MTSIGNTHHVLKQRWRNREWEYTIVDRGVQVATREGGALDEYLIPFELMRDGRHLFINRVIMLPIFAVMLGGIFAYILLTVPIQTLLTMDKTVLSYLAVGFATMIGLIVASFTSTERRIFIMGDDCRLECLLNKPSRHDVESFLDCIEKERRDYLLQWYVDCIHDRRLIIGTYRLRSLMERGVLSQREYELIRSNLINN